MATVSERFRLTFEEKTSNALKADRVRHRAAFNPNKASPGETLYVAVPKLEEGVVLVPPARSPLYLIWSSAGTLTTFS